MIYRSVVFDYPRQAGVGRMLGGCEVGPVSYRIVAVFRKADEMEDKVDALRQLLNTFTPEDRDRILEIMQLALEITHPSAPG